MADLHDDRRKEEEEYGGFEPDRDDDESFMLEDENDYPAKLPDNFSDVPSSTERVTASIENNDSEEVNKENNEEGYSEPTPIEPERVEPEEIEEEEIIETYSEPEIEAVQEIESESIPEDETEDEAIEFDEDFKKKIQEDIDKSKAKREANEIAEEEENSEPAHPRVYSDEPETMVVITDIEADSPSKLRSDSSAVPEVPQPPITGNIPENMEGESEPLEPEKKKKKKKAPIWILMLYSSVATFIITLGLAALIWYLLQDNHDGKDDGKVKSEKLAIKSTNKDERKANSSANTDEMNWLDSMEIDKKDTALTYKEDKEFFSGLEDELDEEDIIDKKPPVKKQEKEIAPKKEEPKKELPKKKKEDLATNNSVNIVPKEKKKSNVKVDESQFSMPQPNGPVPEKGTFTVQIYSSPSLEDAESWLGQLKAKQLPNAMITEQQVKGRTWYRVRYGKFETKEAARSSALELGYSQSWIDRVK